MIQIKNCDRLECLLPHHENPSKPNSLGNFHRQALFQVNHLDSLITPWNYGSYHKNNGTLSKQKKYGFRLFLPSEYYDEIHSFWSKTLFKWAKCCTYKFSAKWANFEKGTTVSLIFDPYAIVLMCTIIILAEIFYAA